MLTNTVGIMLFILAFSLLSAGGASIHKRLPMEVEPGSGVKPLNFLCVGDRVLPVDPEEMKRFDDVDRKDGVEVENEFFKIRLKIKMWRIRFEYLPKPDVGVPRSKLNDASLPFMQALTTHTPAERFIFFSVRPDAIDTFFKARAVASECGYKCGWLPLSKTGNITFGNGGGISPKPQ